jgi:hypothetical protein
MFFLEMHCIRNSAYSTNSVWNSFETIFHKRFIWYTFPPVKVGLTFKNLKKLTNLYQFFWTTFSVGARNNLLLIANTMVGVIMTVNIPKSFQLNVSTIPIPII